MIWLIAGILIVLPASHQWSLILAPPWAWIIALLIQATIAVITLQAIAVAIAAAVALPWQALHGLAAYWPHLWRATAVVVVLLLIGLDLAGWWPIAASW